MKIQNLYISVLYCRLIVWGLFWYENGADFLENPLQISIYSLICGIKRDKQACFSLFVSFGGAGGIRTHGTVAGTPDFEGRETVKTALYFHISSYRLSAKSLVNKGFSCILWLWRFFFLQPCFSRPGTIWAPLQGHNKYDLSNINQKRTKVKWKKYTLWFLIFWIGWNPA